MIKGLTSSFTKIAFAQLCAGNTVTLLHCVAVDATDTCTLVGRAAAELTGNGAAAEDSKVSGTAGDGADLQAVMVLQCRTLPGRQRLAAAVGAQDGRGDIAG